MGILLSLMTVLNVGAVELPYIDSAFECLTKTQAEQYANEFHVDVRSFGGLELCNSAVDMRKLMSDFELIRRAEFSGEERNQFIQDLVPRDQYYSWLKDMTRGIRRGNEEPTATAYNSWGYFTMQDAWAELSTLGRVGVLIHEARHTAGYGHVNCTQGPYKDIYSPGCDRSIKSGGSHAVEMEYYSRVVLQGSNLHPVYKSMARLMNMARANFVFNEGSLVAHDILVATSEGEVLEDRGEGEELAAYPLPSAFANEQYKMKRSSFGVSFVKGQDAFAFDFYDEGQTSAELKHDAYSYYKLFDTEGDRQVLDLEEFDINNKRYFAYVNKENELYEFDFSKGVFSFVTRLDSNLGFVTSTSPRGEKGFFIVDQAGEISKYDPVQGRVVKLNERWPAEYKSFVNLGDRLLGLTQNGEVVEIRNQELLPYAALVGKRCEQIATAPSYSTFKGI